jgi:hypothetical protein
MMVFISISSAAIFEMDNPISDKQRQQLISSTTLDWPKALDKEKMMFAVSQAGGWYFKVGSGQALDNHLLEKMPINFYDLFTYRVLVLKASMFDKAVAIGDNAYTFSTPSGGTAFLRIPADVQTDTSLRMNEEYYIVCMLAGQSSYGLPEFAALSVITPEGWSQVIILVIHNPKEFPNINYFTN